MHLLRRTLTTATVLLGGLAVVAALSLTALRYLGYQPEVVYSGSMRPTFPVGSLLFARTIPSRDVAVGDVISFHDPQDPARMITHRVVERIVRPAGFAYRTRGDANSARDPWTIGLPARAGRVAFHVPVAGYVLWFAKTREIRTALIGVIALAILGALLRSIWRARPEVSPSP